MACYYGEFEATGTPLHVSYAVTHMQVSISDPVIKHRVEASLSQLTPGGHQMI